MSEIKDKRREIEKKREIEIYGTLLTPFSVSEDEFYNKFINWVEENGYSFTGTTEDVTEDEISEDDMIIRKAEIALPGYENYILSEDKTKVYVGNDYHKHPIEVPVQFLTGDEEDDKVEWPITL